MLTREQVPARVHRVAREQPPDAGEAGSSVVGHERCLKAQRCEVGRDAAEGNQRRHLRREPEAPADHPIEQGCEAHRVACGPERLSVAFDGDEPAATALQVVERSVEASVHDARSPVTELDMRPVDGVGTDGDVESGGGVVLGSAAVPAVSVGNSFELGLVHLSEARDERSAHVAIAPRGARRRARASPVATGCASGTRERSSRA